MTDTRKQVPACTCSPALAAMLENPKAPPNLDCQMALLLAKCMN